MPKVNFSVTGDKWEYEYDGHEIVVKNSFDGCQLLVDGKVQDAHNGISLSGNLTGKLPDGKPIKATLGGVWTVKCTLFVDYEMIDPVNDSAIE